MSLIPCYIEAHQTINYDVSTLHLNEAPVTLMPTRPFSSTIWKDAEETPLNHDIACPEDKCHFTEERRILPWTWCQTWDIANGCVVKTRLKKILLLLDSIDFKRKENPLPRTLLRQPSSQYDDGSFSQDAMYSPITRYVSTKTPISNKDSWTYTFLSFGINTSSIWCPHTCRVQESLVEYIPNLDVPNACIRVSFLKRRGAFPQILIPCADTILETLYIVVLLVEFVFTVL